MNEEIILNTEDIPSENLDKEILDELKNIENVLNEMNETEEVTEEVTEEITEEISVDPGTLPVTSGEYQKGVNDINENLVQIAKSVERSNELLEISTVEEETEEVTEHELIYSSGTSADGSLYFADKVENANMNDLYSMAWSIRNTLFLILLFLVFVVSYKVMKNLIYRLTN